MSDPISAIGAWLEALFLGWGWAPHLVTAIMKFIGSLAVIIFAVGLVIITIWMERKLYARIQDRLGPNRVGPWGIFQTFPDMVKIFTKEYITPQGADKFVYNLAPILSTSAVLLIWAVVPFASTVVGTELNVGLLYIVAVGALGALSIIMAGWSSNNKYSLLGAFRAVSQMVAYEVPMVLSLLIPVILAQSMGVNEIVRQQNVWYVILAPIAALFFFISSQAEVSRAPFDLMEADSELVAGYQTEYSGLKFGFFYVAEFIHAFTISALFATIFLGGWRGPGAETYPILGTAYFLVKSFVVYFVVILLRITMPRLRIDHMLNFNWKFLTPVALILLMVTAVVEKVILQWADVLPDMNYLIARTLIHVVVNALLAWGTIVWLKRFDTKRERKVVAEPRPVAMAPRRTN